MGKGDIEGATFVQHCHNLAGNFMVLWLYKNYLCLDPNAPIGDKYNTVRDTLQNTFQKVFSLEKFEDSWNHVSEILKVEPEPRLNTNRSNHDYKKYVQKKNLSEDFISWHRTYNRYDYLLYEEFCT
tara:strand:- start:258 stop:635 length:378 start_codon:yes stop_codon:yes gene_type:complete